MKKHLGCSPPLSHSGYKDENIHFCYSKLLGTAHHFWVQLMKPYTLARLRETQQPVLWRNMKTKDRVSASSDLLVLITASLHLPCSNPFCDTQVLVFKYPTWPSALYSNNACPCQHPVPAAASHLPSRRQSINQLQNRLD